MPFLLLITVLMGTEVDTLRTLLPACCASVLLQWILDFPPALFFIFSSWAIQFPPSPLAQGYTFKYSTLFPFSLQGVYSIHSIYPHMSPFSRLQTFLPPEKDASWLPPPTAIQLTDLIIKDVHPGSPYSRNPVHLTTVHKVSSFWAAIPLLS